MSTAPIESSPKGASGARSHCTTTPRVLHVVLSLDPGGTERLVVELCQHLRFRFHQAVCCLDEPGAWAAGLGEAGIPVSSLDRRPGFHPSVGRRLALAARSHQAHVLHCHHYSSFVYGAIASALSPRLRIVFTEHGRHSDAPPSVKRRGVNTLLGRLPCEVYAVSADLRLHMVREGFPAARVGVIHNGVDPGPKPDPHRRAQARRALGLRQDMFVIGTVARLDSVKDLSTLVRGFADVSNVPQTDPLVIVGDGPERELLERLVRELHLESRVLFAGYRSDARELIPALDVFANTSLTEGVSVTILEAMAAGVPVVATRVGGTPEVVVDGETGLLMPSRSSESVASALSYFAESRDLAKRLGQAGRRRVEREFTLERMAEAYALAYARVAKGLHVRY